MIRGSKPPDWTRGCALFRLILLSRNKPGQGYNILKFIITPGDQALYLTPVPHPLPLGWKLGRSYTPLYQHMTFAHTFSPCVKSEKSGAQTSRELLFPLSSSLNLSSSGIKRCETSVSNRLGMGRHNSSVEKALSTSIAALQAAPCPEGGLEQ